MIFCNLCYSSLSLRYCCIYLEWALIPNTSFRDQVQVSFVLILRNVHWNILICYFSKTHLNILLPSSSQSYIWPLSKKIPTRILYYIITDEKIVVNIYFWCDMARKWHSRLSDDKRCFTAIIYEFSQFLEQFTIIGYLCIPFSDIIFFHLQVSCLLLEQICMLFSLSFPGNLSGNKVVTHCLR